MKTIFWGAGDYSSFRRREKDMMRDKAEEKEKKEVVPVTVLPVTVDISRGPVVPNCQITWKCARLMRQVGNLEQLNLF